VKQACQDDCLNRAASGQWSEDFCAATAPAPHDAGAEPPDAGSGDDAASPPDAAAQDSGGGGSSGADASMSPPTKSGCGCELGDGATPVAVPLFVAGLAIALVAARRRGRRL
jgi:MYXO-CTERM domain-containing protein